MEPADEPSNGLVSLVMPVWQPRRDWLRHAVDAALAHRDCEIELIVVDDGSPGSVAGLLSDVDDPRLRVLRIEHGGGARARNAGVAAARGAYLRFIDADDEIVPESTARLVELVGGRDDVIAYGATMFCDPDLKPLWRMTSRVQGDAVEACLLGRFTTRPHAFLFPRRVIERTGGWDSEFPVSGDWDFILRALEHGTVRGTPEVATLYRRHSGGITGDPDEGELGARMVVDRYFERHPEQRGSRLQERADARLLAHAGRIHAMHGRWRHGLRKMVSAARHDPSAVSAEVTQAVPALGGVLRRLLRRPGAGASPAGSGAAPGP
jgi:glycosyltransferase involved in cell wall biosynthesis